MNWGIIGGHSELKKAKWWILPWVSKREKPSWHTVFRLLTSRMVRELFFFLNHCCRDFPGGPVVENPTCNAGEAGLLPAQGTKIPHAAENEARKPQLPRALTLEPALCNVKAFVPPQRASTSKIDNNNFLKISAVIFYSSNRKYTPSLG